MTYLRRIVGVVCGLAVLSCMLACGVRQAFKDSMDMMQLGQSYHAFMNDTKNKGTGPASADEWAAWAQKEPTQTGVVPLIQQCKPGGKYTFYWNVNIGKLPPGTSGTTVLGYENKVTTGTGIVVMADGTPQTMTAAQFNAATKPPKGGAAKNGDKDKK
jgi:hypothetical protein